MEQVCDACVAGKQRCTTFPEQARRHAKHATKLICSDICGPVSPPTPSGNHYFLLLVDDMSRFMWLVLLPSKDDAATTIKNFQASVDGETERKLKTLRTDRGGNSPRSNLGGTAWSVAFGDSLPPHIHLSRMGWWSVTINKAWLPWPGVCSRPRSCQDTSGGKLSPRRSMSSKMIFIGYESGSKPGTSTIQPLDVSESRETSSSTRQVSGSGLSTTSTTTLRAQTPSPSSTLRSMNHQP